MEKEKFEVVITANDYIDNLIEGINSLSEKIYEGKENEAMGLVPKIADGLEYIYKVVILTDNIGNNMKDIIRMEEFFNEIIEALENEDFILVGDLYKYEIIPILEEVKEAFVKVVSN